MSDRKPTTVIFSVSPNICPDKSHDYDDSLSTFEIFRFKLLQINHKVRRGRREKYILGKEL